MKIGDLVRWQSVKGRPVGVVVTEARRLGVESTVVDVLIHGRPIMVNIKVLEVINESRRSGENKL